MFTVSQERHREQMVRLLKIDYFTSNKSESHSHSCEACEDDEEYTYRKIFFLIDDLLNVTSCVYIGWMVG